MSDKTLEYRPVVENINGKWQAKATMYEDRSIYTAIEIFKAWPTKQEAWQNAVTGAKTVVKRHNDNCNCGKTAVVRSY